MENNDYHYGNISAERVDITTTVLVLYGICQNSTWICAAVTSAYFLLVVMGIALNMLVSYVMVKSKRHLQSISCFMITHLCIVEVVYRVCLTPPLIVLSLPSSESPSSVPCKASYFISSACRAAIFGSLVVIALDRYHNILHPLSSLKRSKNPWKLTLVVWIYSILSSAMFIYTAEQVPLSQLPEGKISNVPLKNKTTSCDIEPNYVGGISATLSMVMTFAVPLVTIIIAYSAIFVSLKRRCQSGLVHKAAAKSKAKAYKMLIIVVSGFVICWSPSITMTTIRSYGGLDDTPVEVLLVMSIAVNALVLSSSLVNPVIYAFYSSRFKNDMIKIFRCCRSTRVNLTGSEENRVSSKDTAL